MLRSTFKKAIEATKMMNENLVMQYFLQQTILRNISTNFVKLAKVTNVKLVLKFSREESLKIFGIPPFKCNN